jgi:dihydrofolate reductase
MRKVFLFMMVSLDGFFEGPNHELDWHNVDEEFNKFATDQLDEVDVLLFGRKTYELMAGYWPTAKENDPVVAEKIMKIKQRSGRDMAIFGSSGLCVSLIQLGLIDEFRIMVNPVVLGKGNPLFGGIAHKLSLELLRTKTFSSGNVLLYYRTAL